MEDALCRAYVPLLGDGFRRLLRQLCALLPDERPSTRKLQELLKELHLVKQVQGGTPRSFGNLNTRRWESIQRAEIHWHISPPALFCLYAVLRRAAVARGACRTPCPACTFEGLPKAHPYALALLGVAGA